MAFGLSYGLYTQRTITLYEKVKLLSVTDELTSLHNRRYFLQKLREEIERAWRYSRQISLLLIDIDNFKQYNDTYGHQQGDDVLRRFSNRLKKIVRENDTVARLGGEEFVIIMPEANNDMAFNLAERLRLDVANYPPRDANGKFTISIGVAGFPSDAQDTNKLLRKADSALYEAKRKGKNKVCIYNNISVDGKTAKS
jgi:diguanylate cyclase (GGDEF)-like protein